MGKKSSPPPPPDYTPIAQASQAQAEMANQLAREQFEWAKETYANDKLVIDKVVENFLGSMERNDETAQADRARYEQIFQPLENQLAEEAASYASPERKDQEMGRAQAAVGQQFQAARESALRNLESYGVNPAATRHGALDIGVRAQEAAAKAAAGNQASQMVDATGRALRSEAINVGRGYPGQIAGQYGTALNAGNSAGQQTAQGTQVGAATMGTGLQYGNQATGALGAWGNALGQQYSANMAQYEANQKQSSGWGSALGLIGGLMFEDGGAVPNPGDTPGGHVPTQASPSRGTATDDVDAKLTAGEFVMPKGAVEWFGQKHFFKQIEKAEEERMEAKQRTGAIPAVHNSPTPAKPTFASRPGAI